MSRWYHRLRGMLGLSLIGGAAGVVFGAGWSLIGSLWRFGIIFPEAALISSVGWGVFGALAGAGFGVMLTTLAGRRSLDELPVWKAGAWGMLSGMIVPIAVMVVLNGAIPPVFAMLPILGFCGALGGIFGSGLVAVAKFGPDNEVGSGSLADDHLLDRPR
jgi:hypothetical protein